MAIEPERVLIEGRGRFGGCVGLAVAIVAMTSRCARVKPTDPSGDAKGATLSQVEAQAREELL